MSYDYIVTDNKYLWENFCRNIPHVSNDIGWKLKTDKHLIPYNGKFLIMQLETGSFSVCLRFETEGDFLAFKLRFG